MGEDGEESSDHGGHAGIIGGGDGRLILAAEAGDEEPQYEEEGQDGEADQDGGPADAAVRGDDAHLLGPLLIFALNSSLAASIFSNEIGPEWKTAFRRAEDSLVREMMLSTVGMVRLAASMVVDRSNVESMETAFVSALQPEGNCTT